MERLGFPPAMHKHTHTHTHTHTGYKTHTAARSSAVAMTTTNLCLGKPMGRKVVVTHSKITYYK